MKGMAGPFGDQMADERNAQQGDVSDQIEHLVPDELILIPEAGRVQDPVAGQDDRVVERTAFGEASRPERFDFVQEAKGPGAGDVPLERRDGMVVTITLRLNQGMAVLNGVRDPRRRAGLDSDPLRSVNDLDRLRDL